MSKTAIIARWSCMWVILLLMTITFWGGLYAFLLVTPWSIIFMIWVEIRRENKVKGKKKKKEKVFKEITPLQKKIKQLFSGIALIISILIIVNSTYKFLNFTEIMSGTYFERWPENFIISYRFTIIIASIWVLGALLTIRNVRIGAFLLVLVGIISIIGYFYHFWESLMLFYPTIFEFDGLLYLYSPLIPYFDQIIIIICGFITLKFIPRKHAGKITPTTFVSNSEVNANVISGQWVNQINSVLEEHKGWLFNISEIKGSVKNKISKSKIQKTLNYMLTNDPSSNKISTQASAKTGISLYGIKIEDMEFIEASDYKKVKNQLKK